MIITGVEAVTKKKYKVELDGQLAFVLYKGELSCYQIKIDRELSQESYDKIIQEILIPRAKRYVMHLLVKADRTEGELTRKLKTHDYPAIAITTALAYVKSYGYVDDENYVRSYIEAHSEKMGKRQLQWKLQEKGINKELVEQVWEDCEKPDEMEIIRKLVQKKVGNKNPLEDKEIQRTAAFLYRKGFTGSMVWEVLKEYKGNEW